ncbi:MAG TPA: peptidoglycan-associated lipoprotein Pal [Terriglobales bacterium]|nr:peptidoglycan-associated lipoprotein Pal [Terriglobales bacterium]
MKNRTRQSIVLLVLAALLLMAGCAKKSTPPPPPPPPPPPQPTASLSANPDSIQAGQSTQLTWRTENATDVSIEGIGTVDPNGSKTVSPTDSTTYRLVAKGPGGTQDATARVTVQAAMTTPVTETEEQMFARQVQDVFFDYDSFALRPEATQSMASASQFLQQHPNLKFTIEGHCDERGSTEYNLALGDSRAGAVRDQLTRNGVSADRIKTISFGKEKPFCTESNEQCWQQNRRAHFVLQK